MSAPATTSMIASTFMCGLALCRGHLVEDPDRLPSFWLPKIAGKLARYRDNRCHHNTGLRKAAECRFLGARGKSTAGIDDHLNGVTLCRARQRRVLNDDFAGNTGNQQRLSARAREGIARVGMQEGIGGRSHMLR